MDVQYNIFFRCIILICITVYVARCAESEVPTSIQAANSTNHSSASPEHLSNTTSNNERCTNYNYQWYKVHGYNTTCSNHGSCVEGRCLCLHEYYGKYCELKKCLDGCVHGTCTRDGQCVCDDGYIGDICDVIGSGLACDPVVEEYNNKTNSCDCKYGYIRNFQSNKCREFTCQWKSDCSKCGNCTDGKCVCEAGYSGVMCNIVSKCEDYENNYYDINGGYIMCNNHGRCENGSCTCDLGYLGSFCETKFKCRGDCYYDGGNCTDGECVCKRGYTGIQCYSVNCAEQSYYDANGDYIECNNHGTCDGTRCKCEHWHYGDFCEHQVGCNIYTCTSHGRCVEEKCICKPGYIGESCEIVDSCFDYENNIYDDNGVQILCNNHGRCDGRHCTCDSTYTGLFCEIEFKCGDRYDCHSNGRCLERNCNCYPGYSGARCEIVASCEDYEQNYYDVNGDYIVCNNRGRCGGGNCICEFGSSGKFCENEYKCSHSSGGRYGCSNNGNCTDGKCYCEPGYTGYNCSIVASSCEDYEKNYYDINGNYITCNNHGKCEGGRCTCDPGYPGDFCDDANKCDGRYDCTYHGNCTDGKCYCETGYTGYNCSVAASCYDYEKNYYDANGDYIVCTNHGRCDRGNCTCDPGYYGSFCEKELSCTDKYDCNQQGSCDSYNHKCYCGDLEPYTGEHCEKKTNCDFSYGYIYPYDDKLYVNGECHAQGKCVYGECVCNAGYTGKYCDGKIEDSHCYNYEFYYSVNESMAQEHSDNYYLCSGHGNCSEGKCNCNIGYDGTLCESSVDYVAGCINKVHHSQEVCHNQGDCINNRCVCYNGYTGSYCESYNMEEDYAGYNGYNGYTGNGHQVMKAVIPVVTVAAVAAALLFTCHWLRKSSSKHISSDKLKGTDKPSTDQSTEKAEQKVEFEALPSVHQLTAVNVVKPPDYTMAASTPAAVVPVREETSSV